MHRRLALLFAAAATACGAPKVSLPPSPNEPIAPNDAGAGDRPPTADAGISARDAKNARVEVVVDRKEHVLGENVLVHYCLVNTSDAPITISVGGDYRGASRALRFKVVVVDGAGRRMPDPDTSDFSLGGIGYSPKIDPAQRWCQTLSLMRYARIEEAGAYDVYVTHDLGWPEGDAPIGRARIVLRAPADAAEAASIVARTTRLPKDPNVSAGQMAQEWADFTMLRYPVYLAPLHALARKGSTDAVVGIGSIPTVDATRALLDLVTTGTHDVAGEAATWLLLRLPDPALEGRLEKRNPFDNEMTEQRRWLVARAWDDTLAADVRSRARALLASGDEAAVRRGAFMIEAVGTLADADDVTNALSRAIEKTKTTPIEKGIRPAPRGACMELLRAARMLRARGMKATLHPSTHGELAVWLLALNDEKPAGWEDELGRALEHAIPYVRELAFEHAPAPLPARFEKSVERALASGDPGLVMAAAHVVDRDRLVGAKTAVLGALRTTDDSFAIRVLSNAADKVAKRSERFEALARRLSKKTPIEDTLDVLLDLFEERSGRSAGTAPSAAEAKVIEAQWAKLLEKKRAAIDAGERLSFDDPAVTRALLPKGFVVNRSKKGDWPSRLDPAAP